MKSKYMDSDPLYAIERGYNEDTRMLMFHSTELDAEKLQEALDIIKEYNNFKSKEVGNLLLTVFGANYKYVVGREYSVVIYILPWKWQSFSASDMKYIQERGMIDEVNVIDGRLRLWWD